MGKGKDGKGKDGKGKSKGKGPGEKPEGCMSVIAKGLAYEVTEDDLKALFAKTEPINIKLLLNRETGMSSGRAFLDFSSPDAVDEAMKLTETELKGRRFFLDYGRGRV